MASTRGGRGSGCGDLRRRRRRSRVAADSIVESAVSLIPIRRGRDGHGVLAARGRNACTTMMRPCGSVRLGINAASIIQDLAASRNSASASCPFRNNPCAPVRERGGLKLEQARQWRQRAGRDDIDRVAKMFDEVLDPLGVDRCRRAGHALRLRAGTPPSWRCSRPGGRPRRAFRPARRRRPSPGKPAARTQVDPGPGVGRERQDLQRIGDVPGPKIRDRRRRDQVCRLSAISAGVRRSGRVGPMFHVKQGSARGAVPIGRVERISAFAIGRSWPRVRRLRCATSSIRRRRRHAVDPAGLPDRSRPDRWSFCRTSLDRPGSSE